MNRIESELLDLEESLMRNDDVADEEDYATIVDIANDVSELEAENEKLRELAKRMWPFAKAYLNMQPMLGIPDSESYDIEIELSELHII